MIAATRSAQRRSARLGVERLENRETPAQLLWAGPEGGIWGDPNNWVDLNSLQPAGIIPGPDDDVTIDGARNNGEFNRSSHTLGVPAVKSLTVNNLTGDLVV